MIPSSVTTAISGLLATANLIAPIETAAPLQVEALKVQAAATLATITTELTAAANELDGPDPSGYIGDYPGDLVALRRASATQAELCDVYGYVGRAAFVIDQVTP